MANTRMQQRRATAAEWTASNPVLFEGEFGVELDTRLVKIGNGVDVWNDLQYSAVAAGSTGEFSLVDGSVSTGKLANVAVTTPKLANGAVATAKIADGAAVAEKIADGAVTAARMCG